MTRILVVEDNMIIANDLARELGQWGYTVPAIASRGKDALDAIERDWPDLIILDIDMPGGMDGIETAARIREEYGIPFIFLTAYSNDSLIGRAKETGPFGYVLKPYRSNELRITIEMAISAHEIEKRLIEANSQLKREVDERRRAENLLEESEERYFSLFNNSIEMVVVSDLNGVVIDANRYAIETMGYVPEDIGRVTLADLFVEEDIARVIMVVKKLVETGREQGVQEYRMKKKGGEEIYIETVSSLILHRGEPKAVISVVRNITDRKRAELSLIDSEQKLKAIVDGSSIPQFFIDNDRRVVYWNKALEKISSIPARDIVGTRDHWKAFYPEERPCIADLLLKTEDAKAGLDRWYGDRYRKSEYIDEAVEAIDYFPNLGDGGKWMHFTAVAIRSVNGDIIGAVETLVDITGRRAAELALQESERKYRELVENANSIILRMDPRGNVTFFNEYAVKLFGFERDEIVGRNVVGTIVPQLDSSGRDLTEIILDIARDPEKYKYNENENIKKSGERVWISWTNRVIKDDSEGIKEIFCIGIDVTERKRAEEELAKSEKKFRELADFMPEIIFEIDEDGSFTYANRAAFTMMGYKPDEMVRIRFIDLFVPDDRERLLKNYLSIRNGGRSVPNEYTLIRRDGTQFPVIINSRAIMIDGSYRGARGIVVDITERRRIETALRESEVKFHSLFTNSGDAQLLMEGALIVDCNMSAMRLMGCADRDQIVGQYIQKFFPDMQPDGKSSIVKGMTFLKRAIEEKSLKFEWQHRRVDGGMFIAEVVFTAIPVEGKVLFHTTLRDITERKQLQEQIINIVDIEQQRLGQNLHDGLGQELTGVAFLCNSLTKRLRELSLPEMARSEELTNQIYRIITMVRTLSRELYPPNLVENEISFTLADFAANIEKMFGISCVFEQDADLVILNINVSTQIYYITREAVNNAIRHGKARNIIIKLTTDADRVILMISDDGAGIQKKSDQTTGLGLRIMAYRMESIHGTFSMRQAPGGGAQVICAMPRHVTGVEG